MHEHVDDTPIELCYLPRGAPELNSAEECWRRLNQELGNRLFDTLDEFRNAALATLDTIEPPSDFTYLSPLVYKDIYGVHPVTRELQNKVMWLSCGFDRPPSRDAVDRFLTDVEHHVDEVFDHLVEQTAVRGLLDLTYCIDSTDVRAMLADLDASKCYDPTADEYYCYGCTIVSTGATVPHCCGFHRQQASPRGDGDACHA